MPPSQQRVYLHVGVPKSGTTYLQALLWRNRSTVAGLGVNYPGYVLTDQFHAAIDLQPERYDAWLRPPMHGAWDRLVEQIRGWPDTSVVSSELLSSGRPAEARRALSSLEFAEVHLICTVRDLGRQLPSAWQENVKTRQSMTFPEFLSAVRTGEPRQVAEEFWGFQDAGRVLAVWGAGLPAERVHVVTVPPPGAPSGLLWERFAQVIGLDPGALSTEVPNANRSLGLAEAELLRRLNLALPEDLAWSRYESLIKEQIAEEILPSRGPVARITIPEPDRPWVLARATSLASELATAGYEIVGDLADLVPAFSTSARPASAPSDAAVLQVAVDLVAELVPRLPTGPAASRPVGRVKRALIDLSERSGPVMRLRRMYWKGRARARR